MSLRDNSLERLRELLLLGSISKKRAWQLVATARTKSLLITEAILEQADIQWNDDLITPIEIAELFRVGQVNKDLMVDNLTDNLIIVKIVARFLGDDNIKGLDTIEDRLEFYLDLDPSSKTLLDAIVSLFEKEVNNK